MKKVILIYNSDGDTIVRQLDEDKFLKELEAGDYGSMEFFTSFPKESDTNYWQGNALLLKDGIVVSPKAKEVITKFTLG